MTEKELLELIAAQVSKLTTQFDSLTTQVDTLTKDMAEIKPRLTSIENTVIRIENDHGQKLGALFDGYKLNSEKLDRIEEEVAKHDEFDKRAIWLFASNPSEVRSLFGTHLFIVDTEESLSKFIHFFQDKKNSFHGISRRKGILKVIPLYTAKEGDECGK